MSAHSTTLGEGILNWHRFERQTDRYGYIHLDDPQSRDDRSIILPMALAGKRGKLSAEVLEARPSGHIGDFARGLAPSTPTVGEMILLGEGTLDFFDNDYGQQVGLLPDDQREEDWLDSAALYRVHNQMVRLTFTPDDQGEPA
jgi:hypothetical protein